MSAYYSALTPMTLLTGKNSFLRRPVSYVKIWFHVTNIISVLSRIFYRFFVHAEVMGDFMEHRTADLFDCFPFGARDLQNRLFEYRDFIRQRPADAISGSPPCAGDPFVESEKEPCSPP